jgi:uncharacterized protein (DUF1919 family)
MIQQYKHIVLCSLGNIWEERILRTDWKQVFPKFNLQQNINYRIAQRMKELVDRKAFFFHIVWLFTVHGCSWKG